MPKVYVTFKPILVEVPENVTEALVYKRHAELGKQVAGNIALRVMANSDGQVDLRCIENVVSVDLERFKD